MVYDSARDRYVVFGGDANDTPCNDVWALDAEDGASWVHVDVAGSAPSARSGHAAVYDPVRDRLVMIGGNMLADVWALSFSPTPTWEEVTPQGTPPTGRSFHSAIYDPVGDRVVVYGGLVGTTCSNETWSLSLGDPPAWALLSPGGHTQVARAHHAAAYDALRGRMLTFGGSNATYPYGMNDVWALTLGGSPSWSRLGPLGTPPGSRLGAAAAYDPIGDRLLIVGGTNGSALSDVWSLTLPINTMTWTQLSPTGGPPPARFAHGAAVDPIRHRLAVHGGHIGSMSDARGRSSLDDTWFLDMGSPAWTRLPDPDRPPARMSAALLDDAPRDRFILFGGESQTDVWALSASTLDWTALTPSGTPPPAIPGWSAILDPLRERILIFGGDYGFEKSGDLFALDLAGGTSWTQLTQTPPASMAWHTAVYDSRRDAMVVFAGQTDPVCCFYWNGFCEEYCPSYISSVSILSLVALTWSEVVPTGSWPIGGLGWRSVYDPAGDRMIAFSSTGEVWAFDLAQSTWEQLSPLGVPPSATNGSSLVYDRVRHRIVSFGGLGAAGDYNDTWALDLSGPTTWSTLSPSGLLPAERDRAAAAYDAATDRLIVEGGFQSYAGALDDVWTLTWGEPATGVADPSPGGRLTAAPLLFASDLALSFTLRQSAQVRLTIHDARGTVIALLVNGHLEAGPHSIRWTGLDERGRSVPAGVYFARLAHDGATSVRRMVRLN